MQFTAIWMDLEGIMLSEINHTEKDKYVITYNMESKQIKLVNIKQTNKLTDSGYQWREERGERQDRGSGLRDTKYCV